MQGRLTLSTHGPACHEITGQMAAWLRDIGARDGVLMAFVQHTSCSLLVQENADPDVQHDLLAWLDRIAPGDTIIAGSLGGLSGYIAYNPLNYSQGFAPSYASISPGNVLTIHGGNGATYTFQLDPSQSFSGYVPVVSSSYTGIAVTLRPSTFVVHNGAELSAALQAISAGGSSASTHAAYTITLANDLTGANAAIVHTSPLSLEPGSTLTIVGGGHTIDGAGLANLLDATASSGAITLDHVNLVDGGAAGTVGGALRLTGAATTANVGGATVTMIGGSISGGAGSSGVAGSGVSLSVTPLVLAPGVGETMTISDVISEQSAYYGGKLVVNGAGTVVLSAVNTFTRGVTLQAGTLELAVTGAAGTQTTSLDSTYHFVNYAPGGSVNFTGAGVLKIDSGVTGVHVTGLMPGAGAVDFVGQSVGSLAISQNGSGLTIDGDTIDGSLIVADDGNGGSLVYYAVTGFTASDLAGLNDDLAKIAPGGTNAAAQAAFLINLPSGSLSGAISDVNLTHGSTLILNGGTGTTIDGSASEHGLVLQHGAVTLQNVSFADFDAAHPAMTLGDGAGGDVPQVSISGGGFGAGAGVLIEGGQTILVSTQAGQTFTFGGEVDDQGAAGSISQSGSGTLKLTEAGDFRGGVNVTGVLDLAATGAAGTGTINLAPNAELRIESGVAVSNLISASADFFSIDLVGLADEAEIDHLLDVRVRIDHLARRLLGEHQVAVLAAQADGLAAGGIDVAHDLLVDGAGQHHFHDFQRARVGDAKPRRELRLHAGTLEHRLDLRPAAMHHHRIDRGLLEQHDVARERARHLLVAHRVPAVLDDDGFLVIALHVRQRLGQDAGGVEGIFHSAVIHGRSRGVRRGSSSRQLPGPRGPNIAGQSAGFGPI
mgnify:CR=1 FL=1